MKPDNSIQNFCKYPKITAFINVNVVTMDSEEILENQKVIINNGIIDYIGREYEIPSGALVIDANGKFLMPGLIDMHVHINFKNELVLYIANGVTTVRNMREYKLFRLFPYITNIRNKINKGKLIGPTIYSTGLIYDDTPIISNPPFKKGTVKVNKKAKVYKLIKHEKKNGYDFIKIYNHLSKEIYEEIIKVSAEFDIPVVGHVPDSVGIDLALKLGQNSIEHLTGYDKFMYEQNTTNEEKLSYYIEKTKQNNIWNCPTLVVFTKYIPTEGLINLENSFNMQYIPWIVKCFWRIERKKLNKLFRKNSWTYLSETVHLRKNIVKKLHDEGANLLLGTDSMDAYVIPGFSAHEELKLLVDSGLTPFEAIKTGTINAAKFLKAIDVLGSVSIGKRADLLLVDGNPLKDIENTKKISGVMIRGKWISKNQLNNLLEKAVK